MAEQPDYCLLSALPCGVVSLVMFGLSSFEGCRGTRLRQVHSLDSVSDALKLAKLLPVLIAVRGKIGSAKPLYTKLNPTPVVLIEDSAEFTASKLDEKGIWVRESEIIRSWKIEAPWYITDGHVRLGVESCTDASHLDRNLVTSRLFEEGDSSGYKKVLDRMSGYQPLGVMTTEKSLPVGAVVTVVGELTKSFEADGGMVIQKPTNVDEGDPFFITNQSFEELHRSVLQNAGIFKWLGFGFGVVSLTLLGIHFWKKVRCNLRFRRIRREIEAASRRRAGTRNHRIGPRRPPLDANSERQGKCIVCWDKQADAVYIPCGHLCTCIECGRGLPRCPVCRRHCAVHKVFFG